MDPKELQKVFKQARAAIDGKDFKEAQRLCKAVLKENESNYNALVFYGVASEGLDEPDEALAAYVKATKVSPEQLLAWQGLCRFYERRVAAASDQKKLVEVYRKLFDLSDDSKKKFDFAVKIYNLAEQLGGIAELVEAHKLYIGVSSDPAEQWARIIAFLSKSTPAEGDEMDALVSALEYCLSVEGVVSSNVGKMSPLWTKVIAYTQKVGKLDKMEAACRSMAQWLPREPLPYLALGRVLLDFSCAELPCPLATELSTLQVALEEVTSDGSVLSALRATRLVQQETGAATVEAYDLLDSAAASKSCPVSARVLFAWTCCRLHRYDIAERSLALAGFTKTGPPSARVLDVVPCCASAIGRRAALLLMECAAMSVDAASPATRTTSITVDTVKDFLLPEYVKIYGEHWQAYWLAGRGSLQRDNVQGVLDVCSKLAVLSEAHALALQGAVALRQGELEVAEESLLKAVHVCEGEPLFHLWLGRAYMQQTSKRQLALACFMRSAKLDRFSSETFLQLGHYYTASSPDKNRALNCFVKAHELDVNSADAGAAAVDAAFACEKTDIALQILQRVTARSPSGSAKWAWLRLGLYKLKASDYDTAVQSLQSALRADPLDSHCWESLADAYFNRGNYVAALKAFTKAHELNASSMYPLFKIAQIKEMQREYSEATRLYDQILTDQPDYVPALKGMGDAHVALARVKLAEFLDDTALAHCRDAIGYYCRALRIRPTMACLWKVLGDACTVLHPLSDATLNGCRLSLPAWLLTGSRDQQQPEAIPDQAKLGDVDSMRQLLAVGCRCYSQVVHFAPDVAAGWHDLGVALMWLYRRKKAFGKAAEEGISEGPSAAKVPLGVGRWLLEGTPLQLLRGAEHCLKRALQLAPASISSSHSWNALGLLEAAEEIKDYKVAQHCFIKAVQLQSTNAVAWVNLGVLYLQNGDWKLANEAFGHAQSSDPDYPQSWIGQARTAALLDRSEEAMDLMRHACGLGHHLESQTGYASAVGEVLSDSAKTDELTEHYQYSIVKMSALTAASDALEKYTRRVTDDAAAYNTLGLLLERQGLLGQSQANYARAVALSLETGRKANGTSSIDINRETLDYSVNASRVLSRLGRHEDAMQLCSELFEVLQSFSDACHLARLYYSAGLYDESYRVYDLALKLATSNEDKAEVLAAMGLVAYRRGELDTAKTALFSGCQLPTASSVHCVAMLATIGIATGDVVLTDAALVELRKVSPTRRISSTLPVLLAADLHDGDGPPIVGDILSKLESRRHTMASDVKASRNALLKAVHRKPSSFASRSRLLRWWLQLALRPQSSDSQHMSPVATVSLAMSCESALRCAQTVAARGGSLSSATTGSLIAPLALTFLSLGLPRDAASAAKKAVHADPSSAHKWLQLLAACHAQLEASPTDSLLLPCSRVEVEGSSDVRLSLVALHHTGSLEIERRLWLAAVVSVILSSTFGAKWLDPPSAVAQECACLVQQAYAAATQGAVRLGCSDAAAAAAGPLSVFHALDAFMKNDVDGLGRLLSTVPVAPFVWLLYVCLLVRSGSVPAAEAVCRAAQHAPSPPDVADSSSRSVFALQRAALALTFSDQLPPSAAEEALADARTASASVAALGTPAQHLLQAIVSACGSGGDTRRARSLAEKALSSSNSRSCRQVLRRYAASLSRGTKTELEKMQELLSQAEMDRDEEFVKKFRVANE